MYIDIHTHTPIRSKNNSLSIYNLQLSNQVPLKIEEKYSVGIHPWYIPENPTQAIEELKTLAKESNVVAIGECGMDKLCNTPMELQKEIFKEQIRVSEEFEKPLIIHCVKCYNEIIELKKEINPSQTWIVHGFRGKPEVAEMLSKTGIILSFGDKFNPESIKRVALEKILIESDESSTPIEEIYKNIATTRNMSIEELTKEVEKTYKKIFQ